MNRALVLLFLSACQPRAVEATRHGELRVAANSEAPALEATWDFGALALGQVARLTVQASNVGRDALELLNTSLVAADSGAFFIRATPAHLEPGAHSECTVTFAPVHEGPQSARLVFEHDADSPTAALTLYGSGAK